MGAAQASSPVIEVTQEMEKLKVEGIADIDKMDIAAMTMEKALELRESHNLERQTFYSKILVKMKFKESDFDALADRLKKEEDEASKLLGVVGLRKLLSVHNTPVI